MRSLSTLLCAGAMTAGLAGSALAAAPVFTYDVTVKTSFGTKFKDCFVFQGGNLQVGGYGMLTYAAAPTVTKFYYTAVSPIASAQQAGFAIAFAGYKKGTQMDGIIRAVGSDEMKDSYTVEGKAVPACSQVPTGAAGSAYRAAD